MYISSSLSSESWLVHVPNLRPHFVAFQHQQLGRDYSIYQPIQYQPVPYSLKYPIHPVHDPPGTSLRHIAPFPCTVLLTTASKIKVQPKRAIKLTSSPPTHYLHSTPHKALPLTSPTKGFACLLTQVLEIRSRICAPGGKKSHQSSSRLGRGESGRLEYIKSSSTAREIPIPIFPPP